MRGSEKNPENVRVFLVDDDHGSPLKLWNSMGSPDFPSRDQQAALRKAAELPPPLTTSFADGQLSVLLQPQALAVIEFAI
jgi:xylan 1,4-beta-xylosidase